MLPGGAAKLMHYKAEKTTAYQNKIADILDWAKERNLSGVYYPVWGTCLGMEESLITEDGNNPEAMSLGVDDINTMHPLDLTPKYWQSPFFKHLPISRNLAIRTYKQPVFYYYHHDGLTTEHFTREGLGKEFNLLATSKAANGKEFVALMEAKSIPLYLTQFHPEKNQFEKREFSNQLDRSPGTLKLLSSFIWRFTGLIRKRSKVFTPKQIPELLHKYLSYKKVARNSPVKSFAKIYLLHNQKTTESFQGRHKGVMNIWVKLQQKLHKERMSLGNMM